MTCPHYEKNKGFATTFSNCNDQLQLNGVDAQSNVFFCNILYSNAYGD
jgi:hypothetical protein